MSKFKLAVTLKLKVRVGGDTDAPCCCMWLRRMLGSARMWSRERSPVRYHFSAVFGPTPNTLVNS